jgi:hypothetical protein
MGIYKAILKYLHTFPAFLFLVALISSGQMMLMYIWKDDNAIFFKFTHLAEPAGYLGRGLFGEGPYKLSVAPYWFIYKLVGYSPVFPYYILAFATYFAAILAVYLLFTLFFEKKTAKISAFLFASGYIASEGFYWLASSWILSVSIILTVLAVAATYVYTQKPTKWYYLFSVASYLLALLVTPVRTHYVIALVLLIHFLWGKYKFTLKGIGGLIVRLIPYLILFYWFYILSADSRTTSFSDFFRSLLHGDLYVLYSSLTTAGSMFITDLQWNVILNLLRPLFGRNILSTFVVLTFTVLTSFLLYRKSSKRLTSGIAALYIVSSFIIFLLSRKIIFSPQINSFAGAVFVTSFGGIILAFFTFLSLVFSKENRKTLLFFLMWFITSLFVYTAYIPTSSYATIDRYLGHSFVAVAVLYGLLATYTKRRIITILVIVFGVLNIFASFQSQRAIVQTRSIPARSFYTQLSEQLPILIKGDTLYFDLSQKGREVFAAAFSVGQMPESTALAWRYGLDRYDFNLVTDYSDLVKKIESKEVDPQKIHAFYFDGIKLFDTTNEYQRKNKDTKIDFTLGGRLLDEYTFMQSTSSVREVHFEIIMTASPKRLLITDFPVINGTVDPIVKDASFQDVAKKYFAFRSASTKTIEATSSSQWQERVIANIHDNNENTVWQPDRILWHDGLQSFTLDTGTVQNIDRLVWKNGFDNNTPTDYKIFVSKDNRNFEEVLHIEKTRKLLGGELQEERFTPKSARFVRMQIVKSLNDDAPGISEAWVIPSEFANYSVNDLESYYKHPFAYIPDLKSYIHSLQTLKYRGILNFHWYNNKNIAFQTSDTSKFEVVYDGKPHTYKFTVPAGGTELHKLRLVSTTIPGEIQITQLKRIQ